MGTPTFAASWLDVRVALGNPEIEGGIWSENSLVGSSLWIYIK